MARAHQPDESLLVQVAELLAERLSDQELLDKLEQLFPGPEGSAEGDEAE